MVPADIALAFVAYHMVASSVLVAATRCSPVAVAAVAIVVAWMDVAIAGERFAVAAVSMPRFCPSCTALFRDSVQESILGLHRYRLGEFCAVPSCRRP